MLSIFASVITWLTGAYDVYAKLPPFVHGVCDFAAGFVVAWVWRGIHGPIL